MRSVASLLIALVALGSPASRADLHEALLAYRAQEYDKAVLELTPLARLGESSAQYNLGMMRLKGEGGPRDIVEGVGWLIAAEAHGSSEAANALQALKSLLDEAQLSRAREHAQRFGPDAIAKSILPPLLPDALPTVDRIPRLILASAPLREAESVFADRAIEIGWVEVACLVDAEGVARETLVIEAMPASVDAQPLIALTRHSKFEPALQTGRAVAAWTGFNYRHRDDLVLNKRRKSTREFVTELEAAARAGDYIAQYQYARLASRFPKLEIPEARWAAALARSAEEAHYPIALYHMRSHPAVLKKAGDASRTAGRVWTQRAAQAGFGPAQLQIALTSWAEQTDAGRARAHLWLAAAAADEYLPAQKYLAALLLELDRTGPGRSGIVQLVDSVLASAAYRSDPDVWQMRAAIHASAGDWEAAIAAQEAATAFAETYKWPVNRFRARLAAFRKHTQPGGDFIVLPSLRVP